MSLHIDIKSSLKEAMKAKDEVRLRTVRGMLTAFTNELVATGKKPQDELGDTEVFSVIKRLAKQRKESIVQFEAAGRHDLAKPEKAELIILEAYLPKMMTQEELEPVVKVKLDAMGEVDKTKIGVVIGTLMKELQGKAEGSDVKAVVEKLLQN